MPVSNAAVNKFCVNNEVYDQVMHTTPIAVEIISQNFRELLNFAGNIPLLTEKFECFFQFNS